MTLKKLIRTIVLPLLMVGQVVTPTYSSAQMKETGREAQSFGQNLAESLKNAGQGYSNGSLDIGGGNSIKIDDLFPGTSSSNTKPSSYYFPDNTNGSPSSDNLEGLYNSSSGMNDKGQVYGDALLQDSKSESPSLSGAAYQILRGDALKPKQKFENDPMLNQSKDVYQNMDLIAAGFGDCKIKDGITAGNKPAHMPVYETCENITKPEENCEVLNDIRIEQSVTEVFIASQGRNYITMEVDLKNGTWEVVYPSDGDQKVAQIPKLDFNEICSGGKAYRTDFVGVWDWVGHGIPGRIDSSVAYNVLETPTCDNGLVGKLQIRDTTSSSDIDWILGGNFTFRFSKLIEAKWAGTDACIASANGISDKFCSGNVAVQQKIDDAGCAVVSSIKICPGDAFYKEIQDSPVKDVPKLAEKVTITNSQCNFNVGQMDCWIDPYGNEQCPFNDGKIRTTCDEFKNNPQCGYISTKCVDGAQGATGQCYVYEDIYDCGYTTNIPTYTTSSEYSCAGPIKCMGDECLDIGRESSEDFAKAAGLLNAAQMMAQDMSCSDSATEEGGDENIDVGCKVFSGTAGTCKIAVGGVQNCCKKPNNISLVDYITMLRAIPKLDGAIVNMADGSLVKGTYQTFRDPLVKGWTEVTKPFASYGENISGAVKEFVSPVKEVYNQIIDQFKSKVQDVISKAISNGLQSTGMGSGAAAGVADQVGKEAADKAASEIMANIGNAASTIMTIYTVYVVTMMLIQIIWACEQEEFEMNAKRQLKSCHYVGSYCKTKVVGACIEKREAYCCFNSPLSRIINEQVRTQKGWGFGSPKNPQCDGLTLDQIADVDWDKIDLTEWLGILQETGHYPDGSDMSMDKLTGSGSILNVDGARLNSQERAEQRMDGIDLDRIRTDAEKTIMIPK